MLESHHLQQEREIQDYKSDNSDLKRKIKELMETDRDNHDKMLGLEE